MKFKKFFILFSFVLFPVSFMLVTSCTKEYQNPNSPTKEQVLASPDGLLALVVGCKQTWSTGAKYYEVVCGGLTSKELYVINTGNNDLASIQNGATAINGGNAVLSALWTNCNLVKSYAQQLIDNAGNVGDPVTKSAVVAYGNYFKALSLGTMATFWENVPAEVISSDDYIGGKRPGFKPRLDALADAVANLNAAAATLKTTPIKGDANIGAKVGFDIDLPNAVQALLARYTLMLGKYDDALTAANAVDLTSKSVWKYDDISRNPLYVDFATNNIDGGNVGLGLPASIAVDTADARYKFYLGNATSAKLISRVTGFFTKNGDAIPVYLPGEMTLIKAEALARKNDLAGGTNALNVILQKKSDPFGIAANGSAYSGANTQSAILTEIYRQRSIELYLSGLRFEDSRRSGRPGPTDAGSERSRNYYPYPNKERDNNTNTPADPAG